jgi:hypothetical protein
VVTRAAETHLARGHIASQFLLIWTCCSLRETVVVFALCCGWLQLLARRIRLRRRYDNSLSRVSVGNRFNCPHPIEASIPIVVPASATALRYLYAPKIIIGRNGENKSHCRRHDYSAQHPYEKYAYHFISLRFPYSIIEACCYADCLFRRYSTRLFHIRSAGKPSSPFEANKLECCKQSHPRITIWIDA